MAAITITWNPVTPAGSDNIKDGDDVITAFKQGVSQRLANGGHAMPTIASGATLVTTDGRHCAGESNTAGSAELAGEFNIYAADRTTVIAVFRGSTSAAATTAGNATGEFYTGALAIRTTGILKGATVEVSTLLKPAATADNGVQDNAIDIGVSATNRFRDLFLGRNAVVGGTLAVTGVATFTAAPVFSGGLSTTVLTATTNVITGGVQAGVAVLTAGATLTAANCVVFGNVTGGGFTVVLPAAAGALGIHYFIQINRASGGSANTLTIDGDGGELIETTSGNATTWALRRLSSGDPYGAHIVSNGTSWELLNASIA